MSTNQRKLFSILSILMILCVCFFAMTACDKKEDKKPTKLSTPTVALAGDTASWQADENAEKYEVSIGGNLSYLEKSITSKKLNDGESFKIRAVGDGEKYSTSDWSNSVTYTAEEVSPTTLATPVVAVDTTGLATWQAVANASGYKYKINNGAEQVATGLSVQLTSGQTIVVKAVGNGTDFSDSAFSVEKTYSTTIVTPATLSTPVVLVDPNGLATWLTIANASGYKYKINNGAEQVATGRSVQLTNGQTIVVKAIGNGTDFVDSAFSAEKTYTETQQGVAPSYLGILATSDAPNPVFDVPEEISLMSVNLRSSLRTLSDTLVEYYEDEDNYLGETMPTESDYEMYSMSGQTVYVQIWLNNPSQYTILSLKLNGTKYQVSGGLTSFFKNAGNKYYNCVYVAVEIPQNSYNEIDFVVSEIEYIANTFINADGTDEFMNDNDTVTIGLPYQPSMPSVSEYERTDLTVSSCEVSFVLDDEQNLKTTSGGWLRAVFFDNRNVFSHQIVETGENILLFEGLEEGTDYNFIVYLYADLHDGNGIMPHELTRQYIRTPDAITVNEIKGEIGYDSATDRYGAKILVDTTLNSSSAEYIKLEILDELDDAVYTGVSFDGNSEVSMGLFNSALYRVRVYYRDTEYPEGKYVEEMVEIPQISNLYLYEVNEYSLVNDMVFDFHIGDGMSYEANIDSFVLNIYDEYSPQYIAEYVLQYLDNPNIIVEAEGRRDQARDAYMADYQNPELFKQLSEAEAELSLWNSVDYAFRYRHDSNSNKAYWEAEKAKGKYYYTFTYSGTDTENIIKKDGGYYVVLNDYYSLPLYDATSMQFEVIAQVDVNEGNGWEEKKYSNNLSQYNSIFDNGEIFIENESSENGSISFDMYNSGEEEGALRRLNTGWVTKISFWDGNEERKVYENESIPTFSFDEDDWVAEYILAIKEGENTNGLLSKYLGSYEEFVTTIDTSSLEPGEYSLTVFIKKYSNADNDDASVSYLQMTIQKQYSKPVIAFDYNFATFDVDGFNETREYAIRYDVLDKDGNEISTNQEIWPDDIVQMNALGNKIRAKAVSKNDYWLDSDWSDWYTFNGSPIGKPGLIYSIENCTVVIEPVFSAESYVYKINNGEENTILEDDIPEIPVENGDVVLVKAVPSDDGFAIDSEWASYTCTDARPRLATPTGVDTSNIYGTDYIVWNAVENALSYKIERKSGDSVVVEYRTASEGEDIEKYEARNGWTYRVCAIDYENEYKPSEWSIEYAYIEKLAKPTFNRIRSGYVEWTASGSNIDGYRWKIDDGEYTEVGNTSAERKILLSTIQFGEKLYVQSINNSGDYVNSDWALIYHNTEKLGTPIVSIDDGIASWDAVENADGYLYKINDDENELYTTELSVEWFSTGDYIVVCATSTNEDYSQSDWSEIVTAKEKLATPIVTIDENGVASWDAVENTNTYIYMVGDNGEIGTTEQWEYLSEGATSGSIQLSYEQTIVIKSAGSGNYKDSDYSEMQKYADTRTRLQRPILVYDSVEGLKVKATFDGMANVVYKCGAEGDESSVLSFGTGTETEIDLGNSFAYTSDDQKVYVRIVPFGESEYRESQWVSIGTFENGSTEGMGLEAWNNAFAVENFENYTLVQEAIVSQNGQLPSEQTINTMIQGNKARRKLVVNGDIQFDEILIDQEAIYAKESYLLIFVDVFGDNYDKFVYDPENDVYKGDDKIIVDVDGVSMTFEEIELSFFNGKLSYAKSIHKVNPAEGIELIAETEWTLSNYGITFVSQGSVSETEWNDAFALQNFDNYSIEEKAIVNREDEAQENQHTSIKIQEDKFKRYVVADGEVELDEILTSQSADSAKNSYIEIFINAFGNNFDKFTYDDHSGVYKNNEKIIVLVPRDGATMSFENIELTFTNGKLSYAEALHTITFSPGGEPITIIADVSWLLFNYGSTVIIEG